MLVGCGWWLIEFRGSVIPVITRREHGDTNNSEVRERTNNLSNGVFKTLDASLNDLDYFSYLIETHEIVNKTLIRYSATKVTHMLDVIIFVCEDFERHRKDFRELGLECLLGVSGSFKERAESLLPHWKDLK